MVTGCVLPIPTPIRSSQLPMKESKNFRPLRFPITSSFGGMTAAQVASALTPTNDISVLSDR